MKSKVYKLDGKMFRYNFEKLTVLVSFIVIILTYRHGNVKSKIEIFQNIFVCQSYALFDTFLSAFCGNGLRLHHHGKRQCPLQSK